MRNIALLIEYDGTAYGGWQVQKNAVSIQEVIEKKLSEILQEEIKIIGAGRTDAGVHAAGQVANFHAHTNWEIKKIVHALNSTLPRDIAICNAVVVPDNFHSRFDAIARRYTYTIVTKKSPLAGHFAATFHYNLSIDLMNEAASFLFGKKSFKSFTKNPDEQRNFICNVTKASWGKSESEKRRCGETWKKEQSAPSPILPVYKSTILPVRQSPSLRFEIEGDRFLHGMVRAIVGTLIDVGRGRISVGEFKKTLDSEDRSMASMSAPACGLFLEEVRFKNNIWDT